MVATSEEFVTFKVDGVTKAPDNFALVTVESLQTPMSKTLPNSITKSMVSDQVKELAKLKVEPDTVYAVVGDCITPFNDTIM